MKNLLFLLCANLMTTQALLALNLDNQIVIYECQTLENIALEITQTGIQNTEESLSAQLFSQTDQRTPKSEMFFSSCEIQNGRSYLCESATHYVGALKNRIKIYQKLDNGGYKLEDTLYCL